MLLVMQATLKAALQRAIDARVGLAKAQLARFHDVLEQRHDLGDGFRLLRAARHAGAFACFMLLVMQATRNSGLAAAQRLDHLRPNVAA